MLNFETLKLEDKAWIDNLLKQNDYRGSEYNFTNNFVWTKAYNIKVCELNGFYIVRSKRDKLRFLFPSGKGDLVKVINTLREYCGEQPLIFHGVQNTGIEFLNQNFEGEFEAKTDRNTFDYIYNSSDLINLTGKKYASKRNHINRFKENDFQYYEIDNNNIYRCVEMNKKWCAQNDCADDEDKLLEVESNGLCLENFEALKLSGGMLEVDGEIVAYTIGERLNSDTFIIHIEKAFSNVQGAYPAINQMFAEKNAYQYKYINREDDVGVEGLRTAKLSYRPAFLLEKNIVTFKK